MKFFLFSVVLCVASAAAGVLPGDSRHGYNYEKPVVKSAPTYVPPKTEYLPAAKIAQAQLVHQENVFYKPEAVEIKSDEGYHYSAPVQHIEIKETPKTEYLPAAKIAQAQLVHQENVVYKPEAVPIQYTAGYHYSAPIQHQAGYHYSAPIQHIEIKEAPKTEYLPTAKIAQAQLVHQENVVYKPEATPIQYNAGYHYSAPVQHIEIKEAPKTEYLPAAKIAQAQLVHQENVVYKPDALLVKSNEGYHYSAQIQSDAGYHYSAPIQHIEIKEAPKTEYLPAAKIAQAQLVHQENVVYKPEAAPIQYTAGYHYSAPVQHIEIKEAPKTEYLPAAKIAQAQLVHQENVVYKPEAVLSKSNEGYVY